jgi:hypothetical protein
MLSSEFGIDVNGDFVITLLSGPMTQMPEPDLGPGGINTRTPNMARIYVYLLGGMDTSAANRKAAQRLIAAVPDMAGIIRDNRAFSGRVVRYLAGQAGIRQFPGLGGLPPSSTVTRGRSRSRRPRAWSTSATTRWSGRTARRCSHPATSWPWCAPTSRKPDDVLAHLEVLRLIDLAQPVAVISAFTLHFPRRRERAVPVSPCRPGCRLRVTSSMVTDSRNCEQCGALFTPRREHARFCSARCRVAWNRLNAGATLRGSRTRPPVLTWASMRPARTR